MAQVEGSGTMGPPPPPEVISPKTLRPKNLPALPVFHCWSMAPVAMLISQTNPLLASPVQKSVPLGSKFSEKSSPPFSWKRVALDERSGRVQHNGFRAVGSQDVALNGSVRDHAQRKDRAVGSRGKIWPLGVGRQIKATNDGPFTS